MQIADGARLATRTKFLAAGCLAVALLTMQTAVAEIELLPDSTIRDCFFLDDGPLVVDPSNESVELDFGANLVDRAEILTYWVDVVVDDVVNPDQSGWRSTSAFDSATVSVELEGLNAGWAEIQVNMFADTGSSGKAKSGDVPLCSITLTSSGDGGGGGGNAGGNEFSRETSDLATSGPGAKRDSVQGKAPSERGRR